MPSTVKRIPAKLLFAICAFIGAVIFIGIYGTKILDFTNTGWLFNNDHDLRQHYIGWCAYRSDPWHFPIGLIDSLSYPNSMSVIYTDSIPLMAVIFKIASPHLPQTFQYFGLFGILSFMLMGGFASLLLRRFVASDICCVIGSVFYCISAPVIQRMYFHTALAAQWLIIAALVLWVYDDLINSNAKRILLQALLGFACVAIHSYFLPMAGMILAALAVTQLFEKKGAGLVFAELGAFCAAGLLNLYILGGFYGVSSASGFGLGTFTSNLNTFINPWEIGRLLPQLPLQNYFQYEGMAYLGAGILMLFVIVAAGMVFRMARRVPEEAFHSKKIYGRVTIILVLVSVIVAVVPNVSYNDMMLLWIPYPKRVEDILSIFRSNGRLIWPAMYILITAAVSFTAYTFRHVRIIGAIVLAGALILQVTDMRDAFVARHDLYLEEHGTDTLWDDEEMSAFVDGQKEFIFMYTENDITLPTGYYAYLHNMRQNNYYFARDIEDKVRENIDLYRSELASGNLRDGAVYVLRQEDYDKDKGFYDAIDAARLDKFDHVMLKAK
ncbi:MAG: hypothetical protein J5574_04615 [Lachnospiraceae bacterium]|nr:hypothetical protein [Lachnospiraceae bacterium]